VGNVINENIHTVQDLFDTLIRKKAYAAVHVQKLQLAPNPMVSYLNTASVKL